MGSEIISTAIGFRGAFCCFRLATFCATSASIETDGVDSRNLVSFLAFLLGHWESIMLVLYKKVNKLQITSAGKFKVVLAFRNLKLYPTLIYRHHPLVG